jgi:hypothetical protein
MTSKKTNRKAQNASANEGGEGGSSSGGGAASSAGANGGAPPLLPLSDPWLDQGESMWRWRVTSFGGKKDK